MNGLERNVLNVFVHNGREEPAVQNEWFTFLCDIFIDTVADPIIYSRRGANPILLKNFMNHEIEKVPL